jgi:hypothetical protein
VEDPGGAGREFNNVTMALMSAIATSTAMQAGLF